MNSSLEMEWSIANICHGNEVFKFTEIKRKKNVLRTKKTAISFGMRFNGTTKNSNLISAIFFLRFFLLFPTNETRCFILSHPKMTNKPTKTTIRNEIM